MKSNLLLLLILLSFGHTYAQEDKIMGEGRIKGRVIDSASRLPLAYATITCFENAHGNVAGGMITDDQGTFVIDNLKSGAYWLKVDFLGYGSKTIQNVTVGARPGITNIGDILISSNEKSLSGITVTGAKNFMEVHLDKLVYNAERDLTSQGGVATDLLKKVPQVSVDADGNVELLGNKDVRVFINGKPSTMFDNNLAAALQSIPASQIKTIEVITSPGAQYDAQGTAGIINIVLKDNKSQGINGSIALSAGSRLNTGSANIHARKGKVDFSISLSGNEQLKGTTQNTLNRINTNADRTVDSSQIKQNGTGTLEKNGYRGQMGMDWTINKKNNITATISYNNLGNINNGNTYQSEQMSFPVAFDSTVRNSNNTFRYATTDWNIGYLKKFSTEGQELNLSFQNSIGRGNTTFDQHQIMAGQSIPFAGANGNNNLKDNETYIVADYAQPLVKDMTLNVGAKSSFSNINSYSENYFPDTTIKKSILNQTDNFNFNREIYAAYVSVTFRLWDQYNLKTGIRNEYTQLNIPSDSNKIAPSYNSFIPSVIISRKLSKNQTIKASYYRRIQRAGYKELNPFIDATDPSSLIQGNPYLKPERTNAGELSYSRFFEQGSSLLINFYYRNTEDDEQSYVLHYDSIKAGKSTYKNVTLTTNENAGHQQLTGVNISGTLSLSHKLEVRGNVQVFNKFIESNFIPGNTLSSFNYRSNLNASYRFSETLAAEFFGNFNSARTEIQGKFPSFTSYSFAVRKLIWNKQGSLAFTTTNPFNKYTDQAMQVTGPDFTLTSNRKIPYQSFGISFTYKFGKMEYNEKKADKDLNNSDEGN